MADDPGMNVSPEDMEVHIEHPPHEHHAHGGQVAPHAMELQATQRRIREVEAANESLRKDYHALMEAKAKKDSELASLLDENENLMHTITTINADNKERIIALRTENDQLKAKVKGLEADKPAAVMTDTKKMDSLFGSLFGSKPPSSSTPGDDVDAKKLHDDLERTKADMEALKATHATALKAAQDEKHALQQRLDTSEKSHAEKDTKMTTMFNMQATVANKLVDAEAQLEVTRSQLEALKIELSTRPTVDTNQSNEETVQLKQELEKLKLESTAREESFSASKAAWDQERDDISRASAATLSNLEKQLQDAHTETESLRSEKEALQKKHSEQREQLLSEMASAADKDNTDFVAFRKQLDEVTTTKEEAESKVQSLTRDLESRAHELEAAQSKITQLEEQCKQANEQLENVQVQQKEKASELETGNAKVTQLESELAQAKSEAHESKEALQVVIGERDAAMEEKKRLTAELESLGTQSTASTAASTAKIQELEQEKTSLHEQVEKLTKEKADATKKSKTLKTKLTKSQEEVKTLQHEVTTIKEQYAAEHQKVTKLEAEMATQSTELSNTSQDRDSLLARLTEVKMKSDSLELQLVNAEAEHEELGKYRDMYENESVAHATAQSLVDSLQDKVKVLEASVASAEAHTEEKRKESDAMKTKFEADLAASALEVEKLRAELPMMEQRINSIKEQLDRERTKTKDLERDLDLEKDKTRQLTTAKKELTDTLESTKQELTTELETHKTQSQLLVEDLQHKLTETSARLSHAQTGLNEVSTELDALKQTHATVLEEKESITAQHAEQTETLEKSSSEAKERIAQLEQQVQDKEMEARIAEKQNLMTIQQLKAQVKLLETAPPSKSATSRTSAAASGMASSASAGAVPKSQRLSASTTGISSPQLSPRASHAPSHTRTPSAGNVPSMSSFMGTPSSPKLPTASDTDVEALSQRIGELTQQNFTLTEQLKVAEEAKRKAEKDSRLKSKWIQQNSPKLKLLETSSTAPQADGTASSSTPTRLPKASASTTPTNTSTPKRTAPPAEPGFFSSLFGSTASPARGTPQEPSSRQLAVSSMLEETLLQKMQLEEELKLVATDVETLQKQNRVLMETLVSHSIEVPITEHVQ